MNRDDERHALDTVRNRVLDAVGAREDLSLKDLSLAIGKNHAYLHQFIHRGSPRQLSEQDRQLLAARLGLHESELRPDISRKPAREFGEAVPLSRQMVDIHLSSMLPNDVPISGTYISGSEDEFILSSSMIDHAKRPPGIASARESFALYVIGDSMSPRFEEGELVYVHPGKPPVAGCDIVVEFRPETEDEEGDGHGGDRLVMIKRLIKRTPSHLHLMQFNPRKTVIMPLKRIIRIYRILSLAEILGA